MNRRAHRRIHPAVAALAALGTAFVALPLLALLVRAPWRHAVDALSDTGAWVALRLSLQVSLTATAISVVLGLPIAWVLGRGRFRGQNLLRAVVILPIVLPPVVGGIALLQSLGRGGVVGRWLYDAFGIHLPFTTAGAVVAATFVSIPLFVIAAESGLRSLDPGLEDAAAAAGGSRSYVFRRVTLPMLAPQLLAGAVLAWARALGEFGATIIFAGNFIGRTQTMPLAIYQGFEQELNVALTLSVILLAVSFAVLFLVKGILRQQI